MTNILAIVTIAVVTNVSEQFPVETYNPSPCPEGRLGCAVFHGTPVYAKDRKTVTTTIKEVISARFEAYPSVPAVTLKEKVLSVSSQTLKLNTTTAWETDTNPPPAGGLFWNNR